MSTRFQFVDDSGETRLAGFLVPEPGGDFNGGTITDGLVIAPALGGEPLAVVLPTGGNSGGIRVDGSVANPTDLLLLAGIGNDPSLAYDNTGFLFMSDGNGDDFVQLDGGNQKIGFFAATPVTQPNVPLTLPSVQDVIDALVALGLVEQSD